MPKFHVVILTLRYLVNSCAWHAIPSSASGEHTTQHRPWKSGQDLLVDMCPQHPGDYILVTGNELHRCVSVWRNSSLSVRPGWTHGVISNKENQAATRRMLFLLTNWFCKSVTFTLLSLITYFKINFFSVIFMKIPQNIPISIFSHL